MADVRWSIWDGSHQMGLRRFNNRPLSKTSYKTTKNLIVDPCNPNMGESSKGVTKRRKSEQQGWICVENLNTCKENHWAREILILCLKFFSEDLSAFLKATPSLPSSILYALFTTFTLDIYCFFSGDFNVKAYLKVTQSVSQCPMALSPPSPSPPPPWWPSSSPS